eukprot:g448.t1
MTSAVTVPPNLMAKKRQRETKKTRDKVLKNLHFSIGDRVEATNGLEWDDVYYPGVVTDINTSDCTCSIKFDDGDSLGAVNLKFVRRLFKVHKRRLTLKSEEEQKKLLVEALQQRSNRQKKLLQRKYTAFQLLEAAVIVIQAYARGYYARKYLIKRQKAALLLIYRFRRYKAERELARRKKIKSLGPRAEKHRIENMLRGTEHNAPAQLSDAGLTCLVEMRLQSTKKKPYKSKYARLIYAATQIQRIFRGCKARARLQEETRILLQAIELSNMWAAKEKERREWMLEKTALNEENIKSHDVLTISETMVRSLLESKTGAKSKRDGLDVSYDNSQKRIDEEEKNDRALRIEELETSSPLCLENREVKQQNSIKKKPRWTENKFKRYLPTQSYLANLHPKYEEVNSVYTRLSTHSLHLLHTAKMDEEKLNLKKEKCIRRIQAVSRQYLRKLHKMKANMEEIFDCNKIAQHGIILAQARQRGIHGRKLYRRILISRQKAREWQAKYKPMEATKRLLRNIVAMQSIVRGAILRNNLRKQHAQHVREAALRSFREKSYSINYGATSKEDTHKQVELKKVKLASKELFAEIQFQLLELQNLKRNELQYSN